MAKKVTKQEYQKALGVVKSYAKQESKVLAHKTKKHTCLFWFTFKQFIKQLLVYSALRASNHCMFVGIS